MPLAVLLAGASEGHTLIEGNVVADDSGFADNDSHAVINEQAAADLRPGMDLNSRQPAGDL
jgi:hypothetical protein